MNQVCQGNCFCDHVMKPELNILLKRDTCLGNGMKRSDSWSSWAVTNRAKVKVIKDLNQGGGSTSKLKHIVRLKFLKSDMENKMYPCEHHLNAYR